MTAKVRQSTSTRLCNSTVGLGRQKHRRAVPSSRLNIEEKHRLCLFQLLSGLLTLNVLMQIASETTVSEIRFEEIATVLLSDLFRGRTLLICVN